MIHVFRFEFSEKVETRIWMCKVLGWADSEPLQPDSRKKPPPMSDLWIVADEASVKPVLARAQISFHRKLWSIAGSHYEASGLTVWRAFISSPP